MRSGTRAALSVPVGPGLVYSRRNALAWLGLCLLATPTALCTAGCTWRSHDAEYAQGFSVAGYDDKYQTIYWFKEIPRNHPCPPIVVHLPGHDIDNAVLASPKAMQELGGVILNQNPGNMFDVRLIRDGARIDTNYENGVLTGVSAGASGGSIRITVDGKDVTLPASKDELVRALGQPAKAATFYHGPLPDTCRSEPHL
jgi:hypothetical protein